MHKIKIFLFFITINMQFIFSQSIQEMQKMKSEYDKIRNQEKLNTSNGLEDLTQIKESGKPEKVNLAPIYNIENDSLKLIPYYFGYDFFTKRDTVGFWENLSIPNNYLLGPGDEIIISLWGETSLRQAFTVSRSGKIYDEKLGILNISGKSISEAKKYFINQFGNIYSTLNGKDPSTFLDISIGSLKSINVNFVGHVNFPGVYAIHPFSNLLTGLIQAGGVDTTGSLRSIKIKRNNKVYKKIDLYEYLIKGNISGNIQLKDQDIILVEVRKSTVKVDSLVFKPGFYESAIGETVKDIISYAGGIKTNASKTVSIKRLTPIDERDGLKLNIQKFYVDYLESNKVNVQDGDVITLERMLNTLQQVQMIGQIKKPGLYSYFKGMNLYDLIQLGGGFNDSTFMKSVYKSQAEIVRKDPLSRYEKIIKINLLKANDIDYLKSFKLQNLDRFVVHSNLNFYERKNIEINGEVNIPGSYPLISDSENLQNLIDRAGGLTNKALKNGISIFRNKNFFEIGLKENFNVDNQNESEKIRVAWKSEKIILMPGDSIIVKEKTGTINVRGEVFNPGLIEFKNGKSIRRYLYEAGGITEKGNKEGVLIIHANGLVQPMKWYSSPKVQDGSTIIVFPKETVEPFNVTQFATNWTQIVSSLLTAVVVSQQLGSN